MERLTTCDLRGVSWKCRVPPCTGHLPHATSKGLSSALLKDRLWIWYIKKRGRGNKMKGVASNYQQLGREVSVHGKHLSRHTGHAVRRLLPTTLPASQARALWVERAAGWRWLRLCVVVEQELEWNQTFSVEPGPARQSCRLGTTWPPPNPGRSNKRGFYLFIFTIASTPSKNHT